MTPSINLLVTQVCSRLRVANSGGTATCLAWTKARPIQMKPETWERLEKLTAQVNARTPSTVRPMAMAALLLELVLEEVA